MLPVVRSGLSAASQEISVISNNIANASSLGFKRSNANFSDVYTEMSDVRNANRVGNGVRQESPRRNHAQGSLILTGNALDLGMNGQGMFILNTAENWVSYHTLEMELSMLEKMVNLLTLMALLILI